MLQMLVDAEADCDQITDHADLSDDTKSHRRTLNSMMHADQEGSVGLS